jgi:anti-sigma regulatory factor (Ser/Thr protein kinase)
MVKETFITYKLEERSYVSAAKRDIHNRATAAGFSSKAVGEIDIIIAELASNLIKHTPQGGELVYRITGEENHKLFEVFSMDNGYGENDIQRMLKDGHSSTNTLGHGLGAIQRLSDHFQIYSMKGWGTVAYAQKCMAPSILKTTSKTPVIVRVIQENIPGENVCGDGYWVKHSENETQIFLGDGLGHGPEANHAINQAIEAFKSNTDKIPGDILKSIHNNVKKSRGLVGAVAVLNHQEKMWSICGVGNIATRIYTGLEYKSYMPHNGILGLNISSNLTNCHVPAERFQTLIMCSDGLKTKWDITKYTSILKYDPAILAAAIFKDQARRTDDMSILVGKIT